MLTFRSVVLHFCPKAVGAVAIGGGTMGALATSELLRLTRGPRVSRRSDDGAKAFAEKFKQAA